MPWGLALFLLVIFAFATPFNRSNSGVLSDLHFDESIQALESASEHREAALLCLGIFALLALMRKKRRQLRINGALGWCLLFFSLLAVVSPAWAEDPSLTTRRVSIFILLSLGALAVAARLSQVQIAALAVNVCSATLVISLAAELASGTFHPLDGAWRFAGVMHPVAQGWNCGLLLIASVAIAIAWPQRRSIFICLAFTALLFLVLTRTSTTVS